ncbi:MAG: hypothetical protein L0211_08015 [Planctomycetaceae bacterium]|nr:hypothetical protein [Planctomycetaceae bacterium]
MPSAPTAIVHPRIISPISGETLPLADVICQELLEGARVIQITGGPGSGKSTALAYLAATLDRPHKIAVLDDATSSEVTREALVRPVVCTGRVGFHHVAQVTLPLAPWTDDELLEYLVAAAPDQCGSVMQRLASLANRDEIRGNPALWRAVLDLFVADSGLCSIRAAIQRLLAIALRDHRERRWAADFCTAILLCDDAEATRTLGYLAPGPAYERLRLLWHPLVQRLLAGERIAKLILSEGECPALTYRWPRPLIDELAWLAKCDSVLAERLHAIYTSDRRTYHAQVATLLFAMDKTWRPHANRQAWLAQASFREALWPGLVIPSTDPARSNLSTLI